MHVQLERTLSSLATPFYFLGIRLQVMKVKWISDDKKTVGFDNKLQHHHYG